jgi:eukaryotic-like serine/threonine-protein kinase
MSDGDAPTVKQDLGNQETHDASHPSAGHDSSPAQPPAKYQLGELLGRGGMGEVVLAEDKTIGRRVAIKRMRATVPSPDAVMRFLREAHIQARLDHPAIVPVHELGKDPDGRPYFTMKRLTGVTLHDVLEEGKASPQKLLRAFVDVCLAIDFAHERGVVHRDIKPSNIMLGDYGEVYVLDWGVARVVGDADLASVTIDSVDPSQGETMAGTLLGTPGYMSPEQMRGEAITPATDIYALGSILFELLTGEPLHPRRNAMMSTLSETEWRPSKRVPARGIAPELDAACAAALVEDPAERPTARALADAVQRYLDGDRDVEARRTLAAQHLAEAREALTAGDRIDAMRFAGRALALHPESRDAAALVTQLVLEPPDPPPPALAKRLDENDLNDVARQGRYAAAALAGYLAFVPILVLIGVRDWTIVGPAIGLVIAMMVGAVVVARRRIPSITFIVFLNALLLVLFGRIFSPMILGPTLAVATVAALSSFPRLNTPVVFSLMIAGVLVPILLEIAGVVPRTTTYAANAITIIPDALAFGATSTPLMLCGAYVATIIVVGMVVRSLSHAHRTARRKLEEQTWMLEQLLPPTTGGKSPTRVLA